MTEHNLSNDGKDTSGYMDKSSSGSQDEVEVLRDHEMGRSSFEQLGGDMYLKDQEPFPKLWLHSTKVDVPNSALDTSGLTFSPVNNPKNEQSVIIEEPELEEESLQKLPSSVLSYSSNNSKEKSQLNSEDRENSSKGSPQAKIYKDVGAQVSDENATEDLRLIILNKEGEIETLKKKVDELSENRDLLNQVIIELREKVEWHSKHLEKYEEESLGREALIGQVQMEKNDLESALKLAEQEVNSWKSLHDNIKEKVKSQEEQIENLKAKVDKYCKANKEQHLLLKTAQQERKQIISIITNPGTGGNKDNENANLQISSTSSSLKALVTNLVDQLQSLSLEVSNLKSVKNQPKEDLQKEPELLATYSVKEPPGSVYEEVECQESRFVNPIDKKLVPNSIQAVRGSSPSLVSLEQMMEKVQQEGMEVLNLSELAIGKRATPIDTPISVSPLDSPKSCHSLNPSKVHSSADSLKTKQMFFPEDERAQLLQQIQTLENELSAKEREELRRRDWLEFQEKEGLAGWCGMIETIGQKQRHELNILEQLGQQRNARAKLEASMSHLQQQLSQAETELRKVTSRLGMERSHVIRLESALQQEKSNFSQLQQSLDLERKRANMMKELNLKVSETLQSELVQCQSKCMYLLESLKEEHELRMELEAQLKRIQREQEYAGESAERDHLGLDAIPTEQCRQLRKIEEECERKALEQELESEKHRRSQYQKELLQLRGLLESRSKQEMYDTCRRWSSSGFPPGTDTSFNAEDMLQNLKGINQVLGWHVRSRDDKQRPGMGSVDMEKYFLEAKCHHLEQKLESLMSVVKEHNLWTGDNSFAMVDEQPLPKLDGSIHPQLTEELVKFKELVQRLYSLYWRSERNRKALAWQKQYFLSILNASKVVKNDRSLDILKSNDMTGLERLHYFSWQSARKQKSHGSFRVLVWTVIATLRMKVLVLRSIAGVQVGCQSLIENVLPTHSYSRSKH
ncbi:hypothetical protein J437_LFUL015311 [Ladona fulva]|uniref:Pericentrin/AKAP-450 centrosomal targeting domain-containing protein n=1 Tax=Ladona fulva TaxID=123851 RepID=A0A8K0P8Z3_LADFU|nr:hypothetical protein J437_LFUL015311 [Ladona fulva]